MNDGPDKTAPNPLASVYRLEECEGWRLLRRHFELTDGFSFIVVTAPDDWGVALLRERLSEVLGAGASWQRVRFAPAAPFGDLAEQLLALRVPSVTAALVWIDADPADVSDVNWWDERREAWKR